MKIGFVFTNYNNSNYTEELISSLSIIDKFNECYIVIVDNKSESQDVKRLKLIENDFPSIKIIYNHENVGYFKGLNIGIEYLKITYIDLSLIVVGNNDLIFPLNFIDNLYSNLDLLNKYPVLSPNIITFNGLHQNPHVIKKISPFRRFIYDIYYLNYNLSIIITFISKSTSKLTYRKDTDSFQIAQSINQGYGACYILGPIFLQNFSSLWAPTFLMAEEFFLSKQLESKGFNIYYEPTIIVKHHDHATVSNLSRKKLWQLSKDSHKLYNLYHKLNYNE